MNAVMKEVKRRMGVKFLEEGRKCRLPGLLYTDDLVLYGKLEKNLRAMVGQFVEMCKSRGLKVNASKSKVMLLNREEGFKYEVCINRYV